MSFVPSIREQMLVLDVVAGLRSGESDRSELGPEMIAAILEGVAQFARDEWGPLSQAGDREGVVLTGGGVRMPTGHTEAWRRYVECEWGALSAPAAFGGQGLSHSLQLAVLEALGTANLSLALCSILTLGSTEALIHHGSPVQMARYLSHLVTGRWTGTMNLTEPQAGSDVGALRATATPRPDGDWSIRGTKIFISFGDHDLAENIVHLVLARTPDAPAGTRGISLFLVPKRRIGNDGSLGEDNSVRVISIEEKLGLHASPTCVLSFGEDGECVGELVGQECQGMRAMFTMMNNARLNVALQGVQIAEAATQKAAGFALERVQSPLAGSSDPTPVAIFKHPDVRRMLLRMRAQTDAARALVFYCAGLVDLSGTGDAAAGARLDLLIPVAKAHCTDIGNEVASLGVQVHGGMGYIEETGAAQFFRDARITPIYEGTNGIQAADLVNRKLVADQGAALRELIEEIRFDTADICLRDLATACARAGEHLLQTAVAERLAGSYPFLTMMGVLVAGWLLERQRRVISPSSAHPADEMKEAVVEYYLGRIVPEAAALELATLPTSRMLGLSRASFAA